MLTKVAVDGLLDHGLDGLVRCLKYPGKTRLIAIIGISARLGGSYQASLKQPPPEPTGAVLDPKKSFPPVLLKGMARSF
jgi:hypothetical protein